MCRKTAWLDLIGLVASGVADVIPANYIVFEQNAMDSVRPVFYTRVDLSAARASALEPGSRASTLAAAG